MNQLVFYFCDAFGCSSLIHIVYVEMVRYFWILVLGFSSDEFSFPVPSSALDDLELGFCEMRGNAQVGPHKKRVLSPVGDIRKGGRCLFREYSLIYDEVFHSRAFEFLKGWYVTVMFNRSFTFLGNVRCHPKL